MYQKSWWYDLQLLRYRAWWTEIGNFRSFFGFLLPWKPKKIKILKKWNKLLEISSLNSCVYTKNHNYMMYSSSDTEWDRQKYVFTQKGQNQIHWIMPISQTWSYVLSIEIFSLEISCTYWLACSKYVDFFFSILSNFCGYICQNIFFIQIGCIWRS